MTAPAYLLAFILATLYGVAFHFWRGGGAGRLLLYLVLGWLGFAVGQWVAERTGVSFFSIGPLHIGMATLVSALFLFCGHWLSLVPGQVKEDQR